MPERELAFASGRILTQQLMTPEQLRTSPMSECALCLLHYDPGWPSNDSMS